MRFKTFLPVCASVVVVMMILAFLIGPIGVRSTKAAQIELPASTMADPVTIITVNSGTDPDTSDSRTCLTHTPCTLRRAVIQARNLPANQKPVKIAFNIPALAEEGYVSGLGIWKIQFSGISSSANAALRYLNGQIIIDGSTQPDGRISGPRIILIGPGTGQSDGLKLGETTTHNNNEIRGLGFQNFKTHIYINSSNNQIVNNWFGLNDDGSGIVLRGGGEDDGSGNTGVSIGANITGNVVDHNVFTGIAGVAAAINGNNTEFTNNYIGTTASGTVPAKQANPSLVCSAVDWLGGSGLSISGDGNLIESNIIAGIRIAVEPPTIQADAMRVSGDNHIIRNNKIGLDVNDNEIGVCGRGIYLQGGTEFNLISDNYIIEPGLSAISLNDTPVVSTSDANTLRKNIIKKSSPWGEIEGNNSPEDAIQITKSLPDAFRNFQPARVTSMDGVTIIGTSGEGSLCPNCIIELFLDDKDAINEALVSLGVVTADASGNWTAIIPAELSSSQGIRTTSTTAQYNTIPSMSTGTTTGLSILYVPGYQLCLPMVKGQ